MKPRQRRLRRMTSLERQPPAAKWQRLSPYLFRFPPNQVLPLAREGIAIGTERVHGMVVFALARNPQREAVELLRAQIGG